MIRILWNELQFKDEFIRSGGDKKIKEILLKYASSDVNNDHVEIHTKRMKTTHCNIEINSNSENTRTFHTPSDKHQLNLLTEVFRCIQIMTVFKSHSDNIVCTISFSFYFLCNLHNNISYHFSLSTMKQHIITLYILLKHIAHTDVMH